MAAGMFGRRHRRGKGGGTPPLTGDELKAIFEAVAAGENRETAAKRLGRNRVTVYRAYNVVAEFERRGIATGLDNATAENLVWAAKYGATVPYVQRLFISWKAWKETRRMDEGGGTGLPRGGGEDVLIGVT